jgi:sulfur carrier protein
VGGAVRAEAVHADPAADVKVFLNGNETELGPGATVESALDAMGVEASRGVAVAVDAEVVPRGAWAATELADGARVEILRAIQGG